MATKKFLDEDGANHLVQNVRERFAASVERKTGNVIQPKNGKGNDLGASVDIESVYATDMDGTLTTTAAIGNIPAGTPISELKNMGFTAFLNKALLKRLQPTVTAPSASISFKSGSGFSNGGVYEVGATAPTATSFNTSFNRGSATYNPGKFRAGAQVGEAIIRCNNTTNLIAKVALNATNYSAGISYANGDELKDNYGDKATISPNPLMSGTITSPAITIYGSYHFHTNGVAATDAQVTSFPTAMTDIALPLKRFDTTSFVVAFASEAGTNTHAHFDYPATKKVTKVECFNPVSGKWDITLTAAEYEEVDIAAKSVQGASVAYKRLQTKGDLAGARQLRFTIANR